MKGIPLLLALAVLAAAAPAAAQESTASPRDVLLAALRLPQVTQEARVLGVPEKDLQTIFDTARERRIPAGVLTDVMVSENEACREHGPVENFGAFVQSKLSQGLRGRDLAAAIRAEHAARGIGRGKSLRAKGAGAAKGAGHSDEAHGRSDAPDKAAPGKGAPGGKPDAAGAPSMGGPADKSDPGMPSKGGPGKSDAPGKGAGKSGGKGGR